MIRAIAGADGWVHSLVMQQADPAWRVEVPADEVILDDEPPVRPPLLRVDGGRLTTPHDDRIAWRRLRSLGHSGSDAVLFATAMRELGGLPDSGPVAVRAVPGAGFTHAFTDAPGLRLRPMVADDLERVATEAVSAGLYPASCPDEAAPCCRPAHAHAWLRLAALVREDTWNLVLERDGQPISTTAITVDSDRAVVSPLHFTAERAEFWREADRPVLEKLKAAGVTRILMRTRPDESQAVKQQYGAVDDGTWPDGTVRLRLDPDTALTRMTGFPRGA